MCYIQISNALPAAHRHHHHRPQYHHYRYRPFANRPVKGNNGVAIRGGSINGCSQGRIYTVHYIADYKHDTTPVRGALVNNKISPRRNARLRTSTNELQTMTDLIDFSNLC
ncbi:uncharacterized protein LOC112683391 [Sipha flava]|uniref:Uncharacterized protein LOC112683391 n=1 Tax=Sipha flava TaxID=143950 RepID=A0A8B8FI32_9HEMI|nr:uncharacterized protein LOC112683391 [Sipha flava]